MVLDLALPFARLLGARELRRTSDLPVIVLTAAGPPRTSKIRGWSSVPTTTCTKPFAT